MTTQQGTDLELIQALDFEHVIACEAWMHREAEGHDAAFFCELACGCTRAMCARSVSKQIIQDKDDLLQRCRVCGTGNMDQALVRVTPIHK